MRCMKKKSILFMLVFALLFMFLSCVSATEHADVQSSDSVSVEHTAPEKNLDTVSNDVGKKASEQVSSDESYQSSDKQVSKKKSDTKVSNKKSDAQVTSNKNTSQENITEQKSIEKNTTSKNTTNKDTKNSIAKNSTDKKEINKLYKDILNLNDKDCKKLSCLMKEIDDSDFDDYYMCLIRHDPKKLYNILETMEDEEYYTIYIMVWDLKHGKLDYGYDNNNKMVKTTSKHITSHNNGHYQTSYKKYNKNYKSSPNKNYNKNNFSKKILEKYLTLNELFDDYFEGKISFVEFITGLKAIGYDTSELVLNDDSTISWREATIPAPNDIEADNDASYDKVVDELGENTNNVEAQQNTEVSSTTENSTK